MTAKQQYQIEMLSELTALILRLRNCATAIEESPEDDDSEAMQELWHQYTLAQDELFNTATTYDHTMRSDPADHRRMIDAMRRQMSTTHSA